jgi:ribosomal protein S18 acetylase RimI-like enzyme
VDISIIKGTTKHLRECTEALLDSHIGTVYFPSAEKAQAFLKEGVTKGEIFVAVDKHDNCLGYIWFTVDGTFYKFPYVLNIAIKKDVRRRGVGKKLLVFFENEGFKKASRLFLLVSDFNIEAKKFYQEMGYQEVGLIPDLIKEGVGEYLMMKLKEERR